MLIISEKSNFYYNFIMRTWEIRYRLQPVGGKYFSRRVEARYQHEANAIFDAEMPSATRCGSARPV